MAGLYWSQFQHLIGDFSQRFPYQTKLIMILEINQKVYFSDQQNVILPRFLSFATIIIVMNFQSVLPEN